MIDCAFGIYPAKIGHRLPGYTDSDGHHIRFLKTGMSCPVVWSILAGAPTTMARFSGRGSIHGLSFSLLSGSLQLLL